MLCLGNLLAQLLLKLDLHACGEFTHQFEAPDLFLNVLILLIDDVNVGVEVVDVVNQRVVLLLRLTESRYDFFARTDSCLLLDLVEGILDDLNVSHIHVHKLLLLLVAGEPFV